MDKYDYDISVDAFTLRKSEFDYAYSVEVNSEIILDVNHNKELVGIEFLDASKVLNVEPEQLIKPKSIYAKLVSTGNEINLTMKFELNGVTCKYDALLVDNVILSDVALTI